MFYDVNGNGIRESSVVVFHKEEYTITKINGDRLGTDGCSTLTFDRKPHVDITPDEVSVKLVTY